MERAGVFRFDPYRIVAARHHQDRLVAWCRPDLMEVDALLQIVRLPDLLADAAVALDLVHADGGGEIVGDQHVFAGIVHAQMDRPLPQLDRIAMGRQLARGRHAEGREVVLVRRKSRHGRDADTAGARRHIKIPARRMRPGVLDATGKLHRGAFGERSGVEIDVKMGQLRPDPGIERRFVLGLRERHARCGHGAGEQRGKISAIERHDSSSRRTSSCSI